MPRTKNGRNSNGRSSIFRSESDGYWHGYVTVGVKENGKADRRHVRGDSKTAVTTKVRKLERERDEGTVRKAGQTWTVEQWLRHWHETIVAPPVITENAHKAYEIAIRLHLIPNIGGHRLDKLEPEHLERLYRKMMKAGAKSGTAHQVHRTIRAALNEAKKRRHITENPAVLARSPKIEEEEIEPFSIDEVKGILEVAQQERNSARWAIALALGLRQGEALGLMWSDIDVEAGTLVVRRQRLKPKWSHGCTEPCGHRLAGHCPARVSMRDDTGPTKSLAGKRGIGLPDPLITLLKAHRRQQDLERRAARELWQDTGFVFTTPTGKPLHPRTDYATWKRLLAKAKVPDRRLHDARHTAATVLLLLGITERAVMGVMGWSNTAMAARYQHLIAAVRKNVADKIGGLLWEPMETPEPEGDGHEGTAA